MAAFTMDGITVDRDNGMALSFVTIWNDGELLRKNFLTDTEAEDFARMLHGAKLLDHFFSSIKAWIPDEVKDYNNCRGEFPRVELTARPIELPIEAYELISELIAYWITAQLEPEKEGVRAKAAGRAIARYEIWARKQSPNHDRWIKEQYEPMIKKNGKSPKKNGGKPDKATAYAKETAIQLVRLYKGEIDFIDGELKEVKPKTHTIAPSKILTATSLHPLTPHQQMRQAIRDAINVAPLPSEWRDDKYTLSLPFGMKLGRHGGDEVAVWGSYLPKGSKSKVGTKSVVVGYLKGDRFVAIEDTMMFEKALSRVMEIIAEHGLNKPTPPTIPASNPVQAEAA